MKSAATNLSLAIPNSNPCPLVLILLAGATCLAVHATPDRAWNCAVCHTVAQNGMEISNFQSLTNLGAGLRGLYQARRGQTLAIAINITNTYGEYYSLAMENLDGPGLGNPANRLLYMPDPKWRNNETYFTTDPTPTPQQWTFNLAISSNTPPDFYALEMQLAGKDGHNRRWSQQQWFYIQVLPPRPVSRGGSSQRTRSIQECCLVPIGSTPFLP